MTISSPVALITGGGSGIGRAVAQTLHAAGCAVVVAGRRESVLQEAIAGLGERATAITADLSEPESPGQLIATAEAWRGPIDILVNNAGCAELVPIAESTAALFDTTFALNTRAPALLIAAAWGSLECVVNISSMATADPFPGFFAYAASKAALESLTRSIINEASERPIRAFSVAPGAVETAMLRAIVNEEMVPRSAALAPQDIADIVAACVAGKRPNDEGTVIYTPPLE